MMEFQILICRDVIKLNGASSSTAEAVPLPLPWGRLWFNCGASSTIAIKPFQGYKFMLSSALRKPSPRQGKGDHGVVDEDAPFQWTTSR